MNDLVLENKELFNLVRVRFGRNLNWHKQSDVLAILAAKELRFIFRALKYFSPSSFFTLYVSQVLYFSHPSQISQSIVIARLPFHPFSKVQLLNAEP